MKQNMDICLEHRILGIILLQWKGKNLSIAVGYVYIGAVADPGIFGGEGYQSS